MSIVLVSTFALQANAWIIKSDNRDTRPSVQSNDRDFRSSTQQDRYANSRDACTDALSTNFGIFPSTADRACSGNTDVEFQTCVINIANALDQRSQQQMSTSLKGPDQSVITASEYCQDRAVSINSCAVQFDSFVKNGDGEFLPATSRWCASSNNPSYGRCMGTLYKNAQVAPEVAHKYCNQGLAPEVIDCVTSGFRTKGVRGSAAIIDQCKNDFDPAVIARRQAEARARAAAEKAKAEAAAAARAAADAKAKADAEAKRKADEAKKNGGNGGGQTQTTPTKPAAPSTPSKPATPSTGGVGTTPQPQNPAPEPNGVGTTPAPAPAPQPAPQDPADSGGGVIVDLPSF
ncbi:hypothetical protein DOE51_15325 [Bdellovibrio sp. NC01]|nr:hypothetical protein DOE51_15325 [Bdellovibrio sp. NC01]